MSDVIDFPDVKPSNEIWVCNCGCSTFELHGDGRAKCSNCGIYPDTSAGGWFDEVVDGPKRDRDADAPFRNRQGNNSVEFSRSLVNKAASDVDACVVVVINENGRVFSWSTAETQEQVQWAIDCLDTAKSLISTHLGDDE
jgi:hypothetical protein